MSISESNFLSVGPASRPIFGGGTWSSFFADFEAILGLIFEGFVTLIVVAGVPALVLDLLLYQRPPLPFWWWGVLLPIGLLVIFLQWKTLQTIGVSLEMVPEPSPVEMALRQRRWPVGMRPLVAIWWWAQFGILLYAGNVMAGDYRFVNPTTGERIFQAVLQLTVVFMAAYASTVAMLFGLGALLPWRGPLLMVWRLRIAIDIGVALISYWLDVKRGRM